MSNNVRLALTTETVPNKEECFSTRKKLYKDINKINELTADICSRSFEELTNKDKDLLLKLIAVKVGILKPS